MVRWYLYWFATGEVVEDVVRAFECIRCDPDTSRESATSEIDLTAVRKQLDRHITNSYLKKVQAPVDVQATLPAWMELV